MKPLFLGLPGVDSDLLASVAERAGGAVGRVTMREFPDGERYVRIEEPVEGRQVWLVCSLHRADEKFLPLYFVAATARDLGAARVGLVAPYLAYMRQDHRFRDGEGITARYFARLLATAFDELVTVDPHLHRCNSLGEVYSIPTRVVASAPAIASWLRASVREPVIIGPDAESEQWAAAVADACGCPYVVLEKERRGDRDVTISRVETGEFRSWGARTPVIVDDIISTGKTMIGTVQRLRAVGAPAPVCVGVHAVFADGALGELRASGAAEVVTCNTIVHPSNRIDVTGLIGAALGDAVAAARTA